MKADLNSPTSGLYDGLSNQTLFVSLVQEPDLESPLAREWKASKSDSARSVEGSLLYVEGGQKYRVNSVVACGGMGVVCEATDLSCDRPVAIKVLPRAQPIPPEEKERFIEEAQITSQLEHPNIVPVHELGRDAQQNVFYSMKYVKGRTLTDILLALRKNDPETVEQFPLSRLLNIFQKVCDAMAFAHSRNVVHCDLKPDNIMICDFGEVVVMDWGLARRVGSRYAGDGWMERMDAEPSALPPAPIRPTPADEQEGLGGGSRTTKGRVLGTPGFMAPERIMNGSVADVRSDIYSLGATLYSLLALRSPVTTRDMSEALRVILDGGFPPPTAYNDPANWDALTTAVFPHCPDGLIPSALSDIAMRALSLLPADRPASVKDLQQEIEAYQNGIIWHLAVDEDFSEGFSDRWEVIGGQHFIKDGELHLMGGEPQMLLFKKDLPGDVRIEYVCRQEGVYLNDISCFMSAVRAENRCEIPSSGYEFKIGAYDNSLNLLMRADRRIWTAPASPLARNKWMHVRAERMGSRLRLTVNNEDIFKVVDRDQLSGADRTAVGLEGWRAETVYSRIRIHGLGTPWKCDLLDLAERQIQKGQYTVATALFEEVLESFPDAARMERARRGCETARRRESMQANFPAWRDRLARAWPRVKFQLRVNNDGLTLEVSGQGIEDLSPVRGLPLNAVYCPHNRIRSLEPLRGMPLTMLNCTANPISDLSPLSGMPLNTLLCECCRIGDLEPLRGMPLTLLVAGGNSITGLEPLRGMPLTLLSIWDNGVEDLDPIRGMELTALYCNANRIKSLEPVRGLPLATLNCAGNEIESLEPVRGMGLGVLHCAENRIESLEPVRGMLLTMLGCQSNRIASLQPLRGMPIGALTCGRNRLTDLVPFAEKPPDDFLFDCDTLSTHTLEWLKESWSRDFRFNHHVKNLDVLLALRHGNETALRGLASEFEGRRYLFVPRFLTWEDARAFCEKLGGHLLTVTSPGENAFVSSMFKTGCWFWMGLQTDGEGHHRWVTGEPVSYTNFIDPLQARKPGNKVFTGRWARDDVAGAHNCFMIEWAT